MPKYFHFHSNDDTVIFDGQMKVERCAFIKKNHQRCKNRVCIGLPYCHVHRIAAKHVDVEESNIAHAGLGLFADNGTNNNAIVFKPNQKICDYDGEIMPLQQLHNRYGEYTAPYGFQINNTTAEDGALRRGLGNMPNHSIHANAQLKVSQRKGVIVASKNIKNGKEILVDYGVDYQMNEPIQYASNNKKKSI